jgi:hypothetical protein
MSKKGLEATKNIAFAWCFVGEKPKNGTYILCLPLDKIGICSII